jgi:hypothetical protein
MSMLAQVSEDTAKSFIDRVPDIIRAAATNPLGLVALIVLCFAILIFFMFKKSNQKIKLSALVVVVVSVMVLAFVAINAKPPPADPTTTGTGFDACKVNGFVYNDDLTPAIGLQKVKLAYVTALPTNSLPVPVATTGPDGSFSFNCSQIKADAFPIHLRATVAGPGRNHSIESEDQLVFGENPKVVLYLSPRAISNHYRLSKEIYRVPSSELFKANTISLTNAATTKTIPTNKIAVIPRAVQLPKETIKRIRMTPN